jgi:thioredoxin 1
MSISLFLSKNKKIIIIMTITDIKGKDVVYFSASWCMPCKMTKPIVEKVNNERDENIEIVVIDEIDDSLLNDIKSELTIKSVPTTVFFKNGVEVDRKVGGFSEVEFNTLIDTNLK